MEPIHQCPLSTKERSIRSGQVQCDDVNSYHCLGSAADGQLRELCTSPIWIEAGKCPVYSQTGQLDSKVCQSNLPGNCPTNIYRSNEVFNYPACLPVYRESTRRVDGEVLRDNSTTFSSDTGDGGADLAALYVVVVLIALMAIGLGIAWWKWRKIRVWITDLLNNRQRSDTDIRESNRTEENIVTAPQSSFSSTNNGQEVESSAPLLAATSTNVKTKHHTDIDMEKIETDEKSVATIQCSSSTSNESNIESIEPLLAATSTNEISNAESKNRDGPCAYRNETSDDKKRISSKKLKTKHHIVIDMEKMDTDDKSENVRHRPDTDIMESTRTEQNIVTTQSSSSTSNGNKESSEQLLAATSTNGLELPANISFNTNLTRKMATLLQENDILVLICENENEMANLGTEVAMTVCTDYTSGNIRPIRYREDFAFALKKVKPKSLLLFNYHVTNVSLFSKQKCSSNLKKLCKVCDRKKNVHALISIPKTKEDDFFIFLNALKTKTLKNEVQYVPSK
uniref:Uncharacterized protein LOC111134236 isoform X3 n=1 Tax=Crassostrea virginica TaxID=6565 RepID=A0A8B8EFD6_CRAVI|nr:uncharacterized protein LOC111134236 isoform X3 [Crassostrea virginica]